MTPYTVEWSDFYFFDQTKDGTESKVRYNFRSPNPNFRHELAGAPESKFSFSKNSRGSKY